MNARFLTPRVAALAGTAGAVLFAVLLLVLTAAQYGFMLGIGWRPVEDPGGAWPSGLALGPHGWLQTLNFAVSGALLMLFAGGLHGGITGGRGPRTGPILLLAAGAAIALMAFGTDPIDRTGPRTAHGWIHDLAFVLFALSYPAALLSLWRRMQRDPLWRAHGRYTLVTALLAPACLLVGGPAYYVFLASALLWFEVTAVKLWRSGSQRRRTPAPGRAG